MTTPRGFSRIPLHLLEQILRLLERGRVECPISASDLIDAGFHGRAADVVDALAGVDRPGAEAALRIAIAERVYRPPPRLELVWTGPETRASVARSTALVVERLFNEAVRTVIIGGYRFDAKEILEPLCRAMSERGVAVMIFVDIEGATPNPSEADAFATAFIDNWLRDVWPVGTKKPDIYYDPRTAIRGDVPGHDWATLHAKCVVVDDERSLITSANFTDRGHTRNIEAGVLITDTAFSEHLAGQWRQLVSAGLVRRYTG
jgi:phosphatidylserine/phosphatidylglycerophosphate/cardiolipin synthase-like enzyme